MVHDLSITRHLFLDGVFYIEASGDLDMASVPMLEPAIREALDLRAVASVIVDLRKVAFVDSAGMRLLVQGWQRASDRGISLRVVNPAPLVRRSLEIVGLLSLLTEGRCPDV